MYTALLRLAAAAALPLALPGLLLAQGLVSGTVTDAQGVPLIGANVTVASAAGVGTITDIDGLYTLDVPPGADSLVFSYIGYAEQTVGIDGRSRVDVVLSDDANLLDEVVVVGYGTVARKNLAGSVDQISEQRIENLPITSLDQSLAGQVQGVQFRQASGQPGGGAEILVRGIGSLTDDGNAPLIVIDGVPYGNYDAQTNNFLSLVNPNDIASITVARDAAEKAIYGSRASAGLILITTKRGRQAAPSVSFNTYVGVQTIPGFEEPDVLNATELATFFRENLDDRIAAGQTVNIPESLEGDLTRYGEGTDWFDAITENAPMYNADVSIRGGSDRVQYSLSLGYTNQQGVVIESEFQRYTARLNVDVDVTDWLTVSANLAPSWTDNRTGASESGTMGFSAYDVTSVARWADPTAPLRDEDGDLALSTQGDILPFYTANPVYRLRNDRTDRENRQILSNVRGVAQLGGGFSVATSLAGNLRFNNIRAFRSGSVLPAGNLAPPLIFNPNNAEIRSGRAEQQRLIWESTLNYETALGGDGRHSVDAFVGYATELTKDVNFSSRGNAIEDENFELINSGNIFTVDPFDPGAGTQINFSTSEGIVERALISYLGRARYSYDGKYFATVAVRSDGSSRFGPDRRFATFPSASLAWAVGEEDWFPTDGVVSGLRVETSFGLSGSNTVADYRYQGPVGRRVNDRDFNYNFGGTLARGAFITEIPNAELGWEETEQLDVGAQVGLLDDRLRVKGTYYEQTTTGLLFDTPIPQVSGFGGRFANIGEIVNRGAEFGVDATLVRGDRFIWSADANVSLNRNEIVRLGPGEDPTLRAAPTGQGTQVSWSVVGEPLAQFYGLQITGLYTEEEINDSTVPKYPGATVGSPRFVDGDGDGVLERGRGEFDDFVKIGDPFPDFVFGLNTRLTYDDFTLQILTHGEVGSQIYDLQREQTLNTENVFNVDRLALDRFRPGDDDFSVRPPTVVDVNASNTYRTRSSASVLDAGFWRFSNIQLTYDLSALATRLPWLTRGSVYASVQNAFIFSQLDGNPMIGRTAASGSGERNIRNGAYPSTRTFTLGATIVL